MLKLGKLEKYILPSPPRARRYEIGLLLLPASMIGAPLLVGLLGIWATRARSDFLADFLAGSVAGLMAFGVPLAGLIAIWWLALHRDRCASMREVPLLVRLGLWGFRALAGVVAIALMVMILSDGVSNLSSTFMSILPLSALLLALSPDILPSKWLALFRRRVWQSLAVLAVGLLLAAPDDRFGVFAVMLIVGILLGPLALLAIDLAMLEMRSREQPFEPPPVEWLPEGSRPMPIPDDAFKAGELVRCVNNGDELMQRGDLGEDFRCLRAGTVYTVRAVDVQCNYTRMRLNEVAGTFGSSRFERTSA